ncbi:hypothetical protein PIB30_011592 [Stylosanthes scabra]|uniref:Uncharacterized protein n=1 Tax=Stylosanthes scabra TaxID=79078 RepID=A0ABU6V4X8_9FABA|nr:hypothetical protein [Stylosanthes scabra]
MVRILHTWKKNNGHETQSPPSPSFILEERRPEDEFHQDDASELVFEMEATTEDADSEQSIVKKQSESLHVQKEDEDEMDDEQLGQIKGKKKVVTYDIDKLEIYSEDEFLNKHYEETSLFPCRLQTEEGTMDILTMFVKEQRVMIRSTRKVLKQLGRELKNSEQRWSILEKKLLEWKCSSSTSSSFMS